MRKWPAVLAATAAVATVSALLILAASSAQAAAVGAGARNLPAAAPADTVPPSVPTGLTAVPNCNANTETLSWTASTDNVGVTGYDIFRAVNGGAYSSIATVTTTSYVIAGFGLWSFEVRARDAAGNVSAFSSPVNVVPPPCPTPPPGPSTPTGLTVTFTTCTTANLTWNASTDTHAAVTGYEIFESVNGGPYSLLGTSTTTSFALTGITGQATLSVEVRARDANGGASQFTAPVSVVQPTCVVVTDTTPPTVPGTPTASGTTASQTTLSWAASTDDVAVSGYDVFRAPGASGGQFASVGTTASTSFTDTGLSPSTTYRYEVRARDAAGNVSGFSAPVTVTTAAGPGGCSATFSVTSQWTGAFQGSVAVTNTGTTTTSSWTVTLTFANGQTITQIWGAVTSNTASPYTITNASYDGSLAPGASTTFGFIANWSGTNSAPTLSCHSS
jgi:chitodextrinase